MLKKCVILKKHYDNHKLLKDYANDLGLKFSASCWDKQAFYDMQEVGVDFWKIASPMLRHHELLKLTASTNIYTYVSTGMSNLNEIEDAVNIFRKRNCPFELMHCVSTYPMKDEDANLNMIQTLRERFGCNVGYSGHESGLAISYAAAALGISSLERHITLNRAMYGSDQAASIEPNGLRQLVGAVRKIEKALGNGKKDVTKSEVPVAKKLREHIKL